MGYSGQSPLDGDANTTRASGMGSAQPLVELGRVRSWWVTVVEVMAAGSYLVL